MTAYVISSILYVSGIKYGYATSERSTHLERSIKDYRDFVYNTFLIPLHPSCVIYIVISMLANKERIA